MIRKILKRLLNQQRSQLIIINSDGSQRRVVYETNELIEAPNWSPDGQWLVFNGSGQLFRIAAAVSETTPAPVCIDTGNIGGITNDHVIAPDGNAIFFTAQGCVYSVPFNGGQARRLSDPTSISTQFYVHGISPDGGTLTCIGYTGAQSSSMLASGVLAIYLVPAAGGAATRITHTSVPVDGAEFSPGGEWIYFNSELHASEPGHSQLYRMRIDGSDIQRLTFDQRVNWFPHIAPDSDTIVYLSYPEHTQGHPANLNVTLRRMSVASGESADVVALRGGQGTINTNSWAPDSKRFAYVAYPD